MYAVRITLIHESCVDVRVAMPDQIQLTRDANFSEVSENIFDSMSNAPQWKTNGNFNEKNLFDQMYEEAVTNYYADATDVQAAGQQVLHLFDKWKPLVSQFARYVLRGSADHSLDATLNWDAEGSGEAIIRPLSDQSFQNATYAQTPSSTGQFNIVPDNSQADGTMATATQNEQAWIVFGFIDYYTGSYVPYDYTQSNVSDNIGVRRPFPLRNQMDSDDTLDVADRKRGPLLVSPGTSMDIDANIHTPDVKIGLFPVGFEVVRADASNFAGILG